MEKPSEGVDYSSKGQPNMTDISAASELIQETFPVRSGRNVKAAIGQAFARLKKWEATLPRAVVDERPRVWTERRVRSLWFREAKRIDHYEMQDLAAIAVEEAKLERQRLKARQERLAAIIAATRTGSDREFHQ